MRQFDVDVLRGTQAAQRQVRAVDERERNSDELWGDKKAVREAPRVRVDGQRRHELKHFRVSILSGQQRLGEVHARAVTACVVDADVETSHAAAPAVKVASIKHYRFLARYLRLHKRYVKIYEYVVSDRESNGKPAL